MLRKQAVALQWKVFAGTMLLLAPTVLRAQLAEAPSAVLAHRQAMAAAEYPLREGWKGRPWDAPPATLQQQTFDASQPKEGAAAAAYSSSLAGQRPIPGESPTLRNACPAETCSTAQQYLCCGQAPSPFSRYLKRPGVVPLTARDNLKSAARNVIDPFNLLTIGADATIGVESTPHGVYGPGLRGIVKYAGVSFTEDLTGEFFGTFLVPSITHQDPHYHREPFLSVKRRILHAFAQVVWTQSDTGRPMFNYGNIVGGTATAVISNTFVPGPGRQGFSNTAQRLALAFAISPSGNLIEEFVPDLASRINLRVVIFQRILNQVSIEVSGTPQ